MQPRSYQEIRWPYNGLHVGRSYHGQATDTTVACQNVRNFDPRTGRSRGAQRAGLTRYLDAQATGSGSSQIQDITSRVVVPSSGSSLTTLAARSMEAISVCAGNIETFNTTAFSSVTGGTGALSSTAPVIFSAKLFETVYWVDGTNCKKYDGTSVTSWTANAGTFPSYSGRYPRLIEQWRTRIVLSGIRGDDHNWFMSEVGDAGGWDYAPDNPSAIDAVAGNNCEAGYAGDIINTIIPYSDDILIFGCDHCIMQMSGDPLAGGRFDITTDVTGMAFGRPWCKAYDGSIYFVGSRGGIYRMQVGGIPERVSADRIEENLKDVDLNQTIVRCLYDDRTQGIHFFFTPLDGTTAATHYFYDLRKNAFFADKFAAASYNPVAVYTLDGDTASDRVVLLGGFDRRIRKIDYTAKSDDAYAIDSYVWLGPIRADEGQKVHLRDLIATFSEDTDFAYYEVWAAQGAERAYTTGQLFHEGIWAAGRNWPDARRASGASIYIKLGNDEISSTFAFESIMGAVQGSGMAATRSAV